MGWKTFFSALFALIVIIFLVIYWFIPFKPIEFNLKGSGNSNFTVGNFSDVQFYPNMRYPDKEISYKIENCPLKNRNEMEQAFEIISKETILSFYPVNSEEQILVTCDSETKMEGGLFIAGEAGPVNITQTDFFNVIFNGKILLITESDCPLPNVAIHELFHTLGFKHSENSNNIMYYFSKCKQTIGQDQIDLINKLYEIPSYPDLTLANISAVIDKGNLITDFEVRNNGLKNSAEAKILVFLDDKLIHTIELKPLDVGEGMKFSSKKKVGLMQRNSDNLKFFINSSFNEIDKLNNEVVLSVGN